MAVKKPKLVLDGFAGPGGWSVACRDLGLDELGLELDDWACRTREAAGHKTIKCDVAAFDLTPYIGKVWGLIMSPPCQSFSVSGKRLGLEDLRGQLVFEVLRFAEVLSPEWIACEQVPNVLPIWKLFATELDKLGYFTWTGILNAADFGTPQVRNRAILMASKKRFAPPEPTHCENPSVGDLFAPSMQKHVTMAEALGWGLTRPSPTVMAASASGGARPLDGGSWERDRIAQDVAEGRFVVKDSRGEGHGRSPEFDADRPARAVTKAARSWEVEAREGLNTGCDWKEGGTREDAQVIPFDQPAPTVTTRSGRQWKLQGGGYALHNRLYDPETEPSPTVMFGHDSANWQWVSTDGEPPTPEELEELKAGWPWTRPAPTVVSEFRPDILAAPGHRTWDPDKPRQRGVGGLVTSEELLEGGPGIAGKRDDTEALGDSRVSVKVTVEEVSVLQGFPRDYPWQGARTRQFQQIGNAIPVQLARAILAALART